MMDVNGRVLLTGKYSQETYIDIRSYSNGVYVLTLDDGLNVATKKIIKK